MKALKAFLAVSLLLLAAGVCAAELQLNGKGIRKRVIFEVYEIGLYLPKKTNSSEEAITAPGAKRVEIRMLRDVSAPQFSDALTDGIRANHSEADAKALEPQITQLAATMAEVKEAKKGMAISLDWNGKATQLLIDGKPAGSAIEGEEFYRALLRIWLGDKPVQDDLKKALLGRPA
jgi:Chalcone isomerase-like